MKKTNEKRRDVLRVLSVSGATLLAGPLAMAQSRVNAAGEKYLADIEAASGGRLGVFALDTGTGRTLGHRHDSRFGLCSTFKLLLAAAILREADAGRIDPVRVIHYGKADLLSYAPVTKTHLAEGMTVLELAEAAQVTSDNTAANLLLKLLGGPAAFTAILRAMGDSVTRVDRLETEMNLVPPGEIRDTTTPRAMAETAERVLTGKVLTASRQKTLIDWMIGTQTGLHRLRAGLPADWRVGDKTGTASHKSMHNKHNDVAILFPPAGAPLLVAAYFEAPGYFDKMRADDDAVLAKVGETIVAWHAASSKGGN